MSSYGPLDALTGGGGDGAIVDGSNPAIEATVFDYTNSNPLAVQLVDANGDPVVSGGGGGASEYPEDSAHIDGDDGTFILGVRNDALVALTDADGDYGALAIDDRGRLFQRSEYVGGAGTAAGDVGVLMLAEDDSSIRYNALRVIGPDHALLITSALATTPAQTSVAASVTSVTLLAAGNRRGATFFNDSTSICYLKLGVTASATSFTVKMRPDAYYELPFNYGGDVDGIWVSATGFMRCTELGA